MSRRGPYKRYLQNLDIPIPATTRRRQQNVVNNQHVIENEVILSLKFLI